MWAIGLWNAAPDLRVLAFPAGHRGHRHRGLQPRARYTDVALAAGEANRGECATTSGPRACAARLVVAQVACGALLLISAGVALRQRAAARAPGFRRRCARYLHREPEPKL